jgi:Tfp pilus assembly protein PilF
MTRARTHWGAIAVMIATMATASSALGQSNKPKLQVQTAVQQGLACDPYRPQVDQAIALINQHQPAQAEAALQKVLARDPQNVGANYYTATIKLASAAKADQDAGFSQLKLVGQILPAKSPECARLLGWYAFYVTLGAQFNNRGDRANAEKYLQLGYAHQSEMAQGSRVVLLEDLGKLTFAKGDLGGAKSYYSEAVRAGSTTAKSNVELISRVQAQR